MWALCQAELRTPHTSAQRLHARTQRPPTSRPLPAGPLQSSRRGGLCPRKSEGRSARLLRKEVPTPWASVVPAAVSPRSQAQAPRRLGEGRTARLSCPCLTRSTRALLSACVYMGVCACAGVCVHACTCSQTRGEACAQTRQGIKGHTPMEGGDIGPGMCHRPPVSRSLAADHSHTLPRPVPSSGGSAFLVRRGLPKCWWGEGCTCPAGAGRGPGGTRKEPRHQGMPFWDMQRGRGRSRTAMRVLRSGWPGTACTLRTT